MKKTLVALTVAALAAGTANAAVVYNQDGSKVEVKGSLRVFLTKTKKDDKSKRTDLKNDASRLYVKGQHDLGNGLSAFGQLQLRFDANKGANQFGNPRTKDAFGGFKYAGVGALSLGVQATNGDDVQLGDYSYTLGGNSNLTTDGNAIKFKSAEFGGFSFGADYVFGTDDSKSSDAYKNGYGVGAFYNADFNGVGFAFNAGFTKDQYQNVESVDTINDLLFGEKFAETAGYDKVTNTQARLATEVTFGPVALAANYGFGEVKAKKDAKVKTKSALVGAKYQVIEPTAVYAQFTYDQGKDKDASFKVTKKAYLVGADYKFSKNVAAFVEYKRGEKKVNDDGANTKTKDYAGGLGVRITF